MKMKLTVMHLLVSACFGCVFAMVLAFQGRLVSVILFGVTLVAIELYNVGVDPWSNRSPVLLMGG